MSIYNSSETVDRSKLKHDFKNDINSLKLNLAALQFVRDDPEEFTQLVDLMKSTIDLYEERIEATLRLIPNASE